MHMLALTGWLAGWLADGRAQCPSRMVLHSTPDNGWPHNNKQSNPRPPPPPQIQAVQAVQAASRQLCHKQMTWFRDEEMFRRAGF